MVTTPIRSLRRVMRLNSAAMAVVVSLSSLVAAPAVASEGDADGRRPGQTDAREQSPDQSDLDRAKADARRDGQVRVIVGLRTEFTPEGYLSAEEAGSQRGAYAALKRGLRGDLDRNRFSTIHEYETIPFVAMSVSPEAVDALGRSPRVASVRVEDVGQGSLESSSPVVQSDRMRRSGYTGSGRAVAILDSGVDAGHVFLGGRVVSQACYSQNLCPNGQTSMVGPGAGEDCTFVDFCKHGTHVAGIAAGASSTWSGVAMGADIIAIQVFTSFSGASCTDRGMASPCALYTESDVIAGLQRVYDLRNAYVIAAANLSLGGGAYTSACDAQFPAYKAAIDNLASVNIATVVASGNDGYVNAMHSPACVSTSVSVGNTTDSDDVAESSNSATFMDLYAPGTEIASSVPGGSYESLTGTSMAAPQVTGAWALLHERVGTQTVDNVLGRLQDGGVWVTDSRNPDHVHSTKRIRIWEAGGFPANDLLEDVPGVTSPSSADTNTDGATIETGETTPGSCPTLKQTVWYRYTPGQAVTVTADTLGSESTFDTAMIVYKGSASFPNLEFVACDDDIDAENRKSSVTFEAQPATNYYFQVGGFGSAPDGSGPLTFNITHVAYTTLSVSKTGTGSGSVTTDYASHPASSADGDINCGSVCSATYTASASVTLRANKIAGSNFTGWSGACSGTGTCTVSMSEARSVTATFTLTPKALTVYREGTGSGTVTSSPSGINCGTICKKSFVHGTSVTLTAAAAASSTFAGWGVTDCPGTGTCTLSMTAARSVSPTFNDRPPTVIITPPTTVSGATIATFSEPVANVDFTNFLLREVGATDTVFGDIECRTGANAVTECWSGAVRSARFTPFYPLIAGQKYDVTVGAAGGNDTIDDEGSVLAEKTQRFRAAVALQEGVPTDYAWRTITDVPGAHGGSVSSERLAGASASLSFYGGTVTLKLMRGPDEGKAEIFIDGVSREVVNLYAPTRSILSRSYSGLGSTSHTIRVKVLGQRGHSSQSASQTWVSIDALVMSDYTEDDDWFQYDWRPVKTAAGGYAVSDSVGASASLLFKGTGITFSYARAPGHGKAKIYVDGVLKATVDMYASALAYDGVWTSPALTNTLHTIQVEVLGQKRAAATGTMVTVDRWQVK